jgi:hypothetical protein
MQACLGETLKKQRQASGRRAIAALAFAGFFAAWPLAAIAQNAAAPAPAPASPPAAAPAAAPAEIAPLEIKGFRSAAFGATEAEVRAAAVKDLGVSADAIKTSQNLAERTEVLTVRAPDVLPDGGAADVAYSLGYKSKKLIQVSVTWSKLTDDKLTPERLLQNGESLRNYFQAAGYVPESIVANAGIKDGLVLFRGSDAQGRSTILLLQGVMKGEKGARRLAPTALVLIYVADVKNPDVYRVPAGKF